MDYFRVKSLEKYLGRGDRGRMPWIKWHSACFEDYDFCHLNDQTKWHAVSIAALAALMGNRIPMDPEWVKQKTGSTAKIDFDKLFSIGFIEGCQDGDNLTPERHPIEENRIEENRREEEEKKRQARDRWSKRFDSFWEVYPKHLGKDKAKEAWMKLCLLEIEEASSLYETIVTAVKGQAASPQWTKDGGQFIPYPATWLNQGRWKDELSETASTPSGIDPTLKLWSNNG